MQICSAVIKYFEKNQKQGYVNYVIEVGFDREKWEIEKRFSDFSQLHQKLQREFPEDLLVDLPPKRFFGRFDPRFLHERHGDLQRYLSEVLTLVYVTESLALAEFLEIAQHTSWEPQGFGNGQEGDAAGREAVERERLALLVEETAKALIDVSRLGVEPPDKMEILAQREKLLRQCDGFKTHAAHLEQFFNPHMPPSDDCVGNVDGLLETLSRGPAIPLSGQEQSMERWGLGVIDHLRGAARIEEEQGGVGIVCHMQQIQ